MRTAIISAIMLSSVGLMAETAAAQPLAGGGIVDYQTFVEAVANGAQENRADQLKVDQVLSAERRAGVLPDPEASLAHENLPISKSNSSTMDRGSELPIWKLSLTQSVPWPGSLSAEEDAAKASTERARVNQTISLTQRRLDAEDFFIGLATMAEALAFERENLAVADEVLKNSSMRVQQGIGSHHDLIQAENERAAHGLNVAGLETDLLNLEDHAAQMMGKDSINGLAFRLAVPETLLNTPPDGAEHKPDDDLTKAMIHATQSESSARIEAERKRSLPRFMLSGMLMQDDAGMRMYGAMGGISVPIFSTTTRTSITEEAAVLASQQTVDIGLHDRKKHLALSQNRRLTSTLRRNLHVLTDEIIPNAKQHMQIVASEYAQGKGGFAAVNDSRKLLLRYQLAAVYARRDLAMAAVAQQRIEAGFVDAEIDRPAPRIEAPDLSSGMTMSSTAMAMPSKPNRKGGMDAARRFGTPGGASRQIPTMPEADEDATKASGMGAGM